MKKKQAFNSSVITKRKTRKPVKQKKQRFALSAKPSQKGQTKSQKNRQLTSQKRKKQRRQQRSVKELLFALIGGSILAWGISLFFVTNLTVYGSSMVPTLHEGDKVLIQKNGELHRFDLVAFTIGERSPQVRRIIGLPEETIRYTADTLYVDDQPVDEKFLIREINESQKYGRNYTEDFTKKAVEIPKDYYFVLGDNRPYATDSRHYDLVAKKKLLGKVKIQLFPFNEIKAF